MPERGIEVSCETVRRWCAEFGQEYASRLRRCRPWPGGGWNPEEVFVAIDGKLPSRHILGKRSCQELTSFCQLQQHRLSAEDLPAMRRGLLSAEAQLWQGSTAAAGPQEIRRRVSIVSPSCTRGAPDDGRR